MNVITTFKTARAWRFGRARVGKPSGRKAPPSVLVGVVALLVLLLGAGCGHIDTTPAGNPDRVLTGAVNFSGTLPAGAEVLVRVIDPHGSDRAASARDLPVATQPTMERAERVLGEARQVLSSPSAQPVPFRVEYYADDALLRRGLNVDVRVAIDGKVQLRTVNAHAITLRSAGFEQAVAVQKVQ